MIYNGKEVEFPAVMKISFFKAIEALENMAKDEDKGVSNYAKEILKDVAQHPELSDGIEDLETLKKYKQSIKKIGRILFPDALSTNEIKALTPPFYFEPMLTSTRFDNIVNASGQPFSYEMKDVDEDTFYLYCCYFILASYFKYPIPGGGVMKLEIFNKDQGLMKTYKMLINADMCEFIPTKKAKKITHEDFEELMDNFDDIKVWKKKFPPNSWIMKGVNVINLVDVSLDQSLAAMTSNLLVKATDTFEKIQHSIRGLLNNPKINIGVLTLDNNNLAALNKEDVNSILLDNNESLNCKSDMSDYAYDHLIQNKEPLAISDVRRYHEKYKSPLSEKLLATKTQSYIAAPLVHEGELLGFMELASPNRYELNAGSLSRLNEVLPILAMAHKRFMTEAQNRIEAIIQQECTTIHPSVKWKFEQEAERFMNQQFKNEQPVFNDIKFDHLYPLYGQMDIKGSSTRRNEAITKDLLKQINAVKKVLRQVFERTKMPAYDELSFRLDQHKKELKKGLSAGSEHQILSFFRSEIYPVFDHLRQKDNDLKEVIDQFNEQLDPDLKTVYEERRKFDTSVNLINQRLASYLDEKQKKAQEMFPHYFERYKTDGVEYNMYIGQSISPNKTFDRIFLRNLRIWQLLVMCEMENEFRAIQKELPVPIEVASLVLVYNTPLTVHFRMDEKKFDVEGAYNARYEIVKKRVDKAHIKGTEERITQPGRLAIIFSQEEDAQEYRMYLKFLASKGYLKAEFEELELENLQGITGLRALRAEVAYAGDLSVDELIATIEAGSTN